MAFSFEKAIVVIRHPLLQPRVRLRFLDVDRLLLHLGDLAGFEGDLHVFVDVYLLGA